jgi:hypothetical protein
MCWQVRIQMAVRQLGHGVETEDRLGGREVELGQVEIGAPGVHAGIHIVSVSRRIVVCNCSGENSQGKSRK